MRNQDKACKVDGCKRAPSSRGWCRFHYQRWYLHHDPLHTDTPNRVIGSPAVRFWAKVERGPSCWHWLGFRHKDGYGLFRVGSTKDHTRRLIYAHRFAYELTAVIPPGLELDHLCNTRDCVNPAHLEVVSHAENVRRRDIAKANMKR
jgi:hypothetical protein